MSQPKAIIDCRVSSRNQEKDGHGLEGQETRCRQHADAKGYEVVATFPDTMTGGGDFMKRPGMVPLLSFMDAQPDENFVVIFDDLKRASRDTLAFLDLRDAFRDRQAQVERLNFKLDDSPEGEFLETLFAAQGQLERKQNGRQVAQKMRARMENGFWIHNPPVAYRYEKQPNQGRVLVRNPPFDAIIKEAFEGYASGHFQTQAEVKRFFESFPEFPRLKNGKLTQQRVTDILTHPIYTGHICSDTYELHWIKAQHEPLISLATFDRVQERRKAVAKAPKRANIGDAFALRGVAVCDCCGAPLRSSFARGKLGKRYPYYLCQTKTCEAYGKSIRRDQLEGDVGELIKSLQPTDGLMRAAAAMFRHIWETRQTQAAELARAGKRQIAAIDKEIDKLLDLIMTSGNTTVIRKYEEKITQHERQKALLAEKLANQAAPNGTWEEKLEPALTFLANPSKLREKGNITLRRAVLKLAFKDRIRYCRNEGARTPEIAFLFKALRGFNALEVQSGAADGTNLEPLELQSLLSELEDWADILNGSPEVIHKLRELAGGSEQKETNDTRAKRNALRSHVRLGPTL
ncbi:MAG: recombinase family protein [Pseudomonadota bacterium]